MAGSKSFEQAQVCAGGVHTDEINPRTMESKLVPNVYFAGEVVDIDGYVRRLQFYSGHGRAVMLPAGMRQNDTGHISLCGVQNNGCVKDL